MTKNKKNQRRRPRAPRARTGNGNDPRPITENKLISWAYDETIELTGTDRVAYLNSDILGNLRRLSGVPDTFGSYRMVIFLRSVEVWELSGKTVSLVLNDPTGLNAVNGPNESMAVSQSRHDYAGRNQWAHVRMTYPLRTRQFPIVTGGTSEVKKVVFTLGSADQNGGSFLVRLRFAARRPAADDQETYRVVTRDECARKLPIQYTQARGCLTNPDSIGDSSVSESSPVKLQTVADITQRFENLSTHTPL